MEEPVAVDALERELIFGEDFAFVEAETRGSVVNIFAILADPIFC